MAEVIANGTTGQNVQIPAIHFRIAQEIIVVVEGRGCGVQVGSLEANAGRDANLAEVNRIHDEPGRHLLDQIEVIRVYADGRGIERKLRQVSVQIVDQFGPTGGRAEGIVVRIVVVVGERADELRHRQRTVGRIGGSIGIVELVLVAKLSTDFEGGEMRAKVIALCVSSGDLQIQLG